MRSILHSTSLLPLLLLSPLLSHVQATQWTIKSYAVETTYVETFDSSPTDTYSGTTTVYLTNLATTPTVTPTSSTSDVSSSSNVTYITYFYPPGAVPQAVLASATQTDTTTAFTLTDFYLPVEYTAPASCPSQFTYTSSTLVNVPLGAETQLTPTSTTTSLLNNGDVVETAYLSPNAVPLETPPSTTDFDYEYYVARCTNPATTSSYDGASATAYNPYSPSYTGLRSGGDDYDYGYSDVSCLGSLCPFWLIYIIIFCTLIPLFFILGLFESYFWFSRLMKGKYALRGVPIFWVFISLWALCCLRTSQHAQPQAQAQLEKQWREMGTGTRLSLWFKYGFRHRNPPQVEALKSQTQQQQPMMQQGPPGQQAYYYHPGQQPGQQQAYYPPAGQQQQQQQQQPYYPSKGAAGSSPPPGQQPYYPPPNQPTNSYYAPPGAPGPGSPPPQGQQQQQAYYPPPVAAQQQQQYHTSSPSSPSSPGAQPYQASPQQLHQPGWQQQTRDLAPAEITQPQAVSPVSPSESHGGPGMPHTHGSAPTGQS